MKNLTESQNAPLPSLTTYTGSYADNVLRIALDIGEGLLRNGADIHRVEFAVGKICRTYGAAHIDVFSIHSLILVAIYMPDGTHSTQSRRIIDTANDLTRLELYNSLSRELCENKPSIEEADKKIHSIKHGNAYPFPLILLGYILAAGSFSIFFGGSLADGICAALIGIVMALLDSIKTNYFNKMAKTTLISFVAGVLACFAVRFGIGDSVDMIIVGTIMLLIPGLSLGNAMRDLLGGETLAGSIKLVQAVIIAVMMAIGYSLAILLAGGGI